LSAVTGEDLQSSVEKLDATYEGSIGRLGKLDSSLKGLSKAELENGAAIDILAAKYEGFAVAAGETTAGKIAKAQNQFDELQEAVGGQILINFGRLVDAFTALNNGDINGALAKLDEFGDAVNFLGNPFLELVSAIQNFRNAFEQIANGEFTAAFQSFGNAILDTIEGVVPGFKLVENGLQKIGEQLGIIDDESEQSPFATGKFASGFDLFAKAVAAGGDELETFYQKAKSVYGTTRKEFDEYVKAQKAATAATKDDIPPKGDQLTALQMLNAELKKYTENVLNTIASGGIVKKSDIDKINELEAKLKSIASQFDRLRKPQNDKPITNDATGFDTETGTVDFAQRQFDATKDILNKGLDAFNAVEDAKQAKIEETKQKQKEAAQSALQTTLELLNSVSQIVNSVYQAQQNELESATRNEIELVRESTLSQEEKAKKIDEINKKSAQKAYEIQRKQFETNQAIAIVQAIINTAAGVASAFGTAGDIYAGIALAVVAAAAGAAQIAVIASQKPPSPPSFFSGTSYVQRGNNPVGRDTVPAYLHEGEAVITAEKNAKYKGLSAAINSGNLESFLATSTGSPLIAEYEKKRQKQERSLMAESMAMHFSGGKLNDRNIVGVGVQGNKILGEIAENTKQQRRNKRSVN